MMVKGDRTEEIVKRYGRTPEQLAEDIKKMEEAKKQMSRNAADLDANIKKFHEMTDPIIDPNTGQPMCWVRRPSAQEWEDMTPTELTGYKSPEEIPQEIAQKYKDRQFDMMASLIANPIHPAKWWKENTDLLFQEMFQIHLTDVYRKLGLMVANF